MKIKICGMKDPVNIRQMATLPVDMLGFIFYENSPRYAGNLAPEALNPVPPEILKVGVFVDSDMDYILCKAKQYNLDMIQLHGSETPLFCRGIRNCGYRVIKNIPVGGKDDLSNCQLYENSCDYFLFDTKTPQHGGSGRKFDWQILSGYDSDTPYFLSGGIGEDEFRSSELKTFCASASNLYAIDLNSRFEIAPGIKDIEKLKSVLT
ncbi:MAG: phosphoribosylanthranilate isomerase [Dysgonamonadaceae bacterium]|jgi:phosphoribosylanthranilate isomerase|nr:phosphoribosylanthranilate isomerase [Dysgonamonadaceae bacterium]